MSPMGRKAPDPSVFKIREPVAGVEANLNPEDLRDFYNRTRLSAIVDDDGDYIVPNYPRYASGEYPALDNLIQSGVAPREEYTHSVALPKGIVKQLDYQYADYNKKAQEIFSKIPYNAYNRKYLGNLGKMISLKGLNNISSSVDLEKALKEIVKMMSRYEEYTEKVNVPNAYTEDLSSMRKVRALEEDLVSKDDEAFRLSALYQIARAANETPKSRIPPEAEFRKMTLDEQREWADSLGISKKLEGIRLQTYDDLDAILFSLAEEGNDLDEVISKEHVRKLRDFKYAPDIKKVVEAEGWKLAPNYMALEQRADEHNNCLISSRYDEKIAFKECLVLTKGNATAEIELTKDEYGNIKDTKVKQIKGPSNKELMFTDDTESTFSNLFYEVNGIASDIRGMNVNDDEGMEKVISDIFAKHVIQPASPHLVSAINRRF